MGAGRLGMLPCSTLALCSKAFARKLAMLLERRSSLYGSHLLEDGEMEDEGEVLAADLLGDMQLLRCWFGGDCCAVCRMFGMEADSKKK